MGNPLRKSIGRMPFWALGLCMALILGLALPILLAPASMLRAQSGYSYTVRPGDSWGTVAERTGVSIEALQEANADKVRETAWLLEGEELTVPVATGAAQREHEVQIGESWNSIADRYNISVSLLQAANPRAVRSGMLLYRGERLVIPPPLATATATSDAEPDAEPGESEDADQTDAEEAADTPSESVTVTVEIPAAGVTATLTATPTVTLTATSTATPIASEETAVEEGADAEAVATPTPVAEEEAADVTDEADATEVDPDEVDPDEVDPDAADTVDADGAETSTAAADLPACPARFVDYPQALSAAANLDPATGPENLRTFLEGCEALVDGGFVAQDLTGNEIDDVVVVYSNPSGESIFVESDLVIFNGDEDGYILAYRARAAGDVRLLTVDDINSDGWMDVAWIDTTCGASTCFDTVNVRSWANELWSDWTEGTITMAYAAIELTAELTILDAEDSATPENADAADIEGQAIVLQGGIYGSVGAGPQRSREEIWASVDGAPYSLHSREYATSECIYHVVIDANEAFLQGDDDNFAEAQRLYSQAVNDTELLTCWVREEEEEELRSFSLFRLALIAGYQDDPETASAHAETLIETYPTGIYEAVATIWLREYLAQESAAGACTVVTEFAEQTPETWEILADYGYTNPGFEPADVCPVLVPPDPDTGEEAEDELDDSNEEETAGAPEGALVSFPECPDDLTGYTAALPQALSTAAGDEGLLEAWLTGCRALDASRGGFLLTDITGNGIDDAVIFPVLVTDLGFGPGGAQGTTLIFHATDNGDYELVANPEIYGKPEPLIVDDLNGDGQTEVAWTVTGCSSFCVTEVQMWSWDGTDYTPAILPGATMANAEVSFEPVVPGDASAGTQLLLYGGVSGTADGGLETPHWEEWRSIDSAPYQRVRWEYDRTAPGSECLGLRLVEADVALQAADAIGYGAAMELYSDALTDLAEGDLTACSLMGLDAETELSLLVGLAHFRLIQTYALAGEDATAAEILAEFEETGTQTDYVNAARQWWDAYSAGLVADDTPAVAAESACATVLPVFDENPALWQVTDQYGYNHPVLAAEQLCFAP